MIGTPSHASVGAPDPNSRPLVSVIIPTYKDWQRLQQCLDALGQQTVAPQAVEMIVVDNDEAALPAHRQPCGATYVHEPAGHSYAARNAGVRVARGAVLAFTDSDCIPRPDWIERGLEALKGSEADIVGGRIEMFVKQNSFAARYDLAYGLQQERFFLAWGGFATANLFVRRSVIDRVGAFRATLESGGDFEFCQRAQSAGLRLTYGSDAVVRHPARSSMDALFKQSTRVARGVVEYCYKRDCANPREALGHALAHLRPRPRDYYYALCGGRGSEVLPWQHRPAAAACRVLMQYQFAWSLLSAIRQASNQGGWGNE